MVEDDLVDVLLDGLLLAEDDVALSLNVGIAELGVLEDVGEELEHLEGVRRERRRRRREGEERRGEEGGPWGRPS